MPKDVNDPTKQNEAKESSTLTIMLGKSDKVYYYEGKLDESASNFKSATWKEIRDEIIKKKRSTAKEDLVIIIKPSVEANYKDVVDILDEMTINEIERYAMVDISDGEAQLVKISDDSAK